MVIFIYLVFCNYYFQFIHYFIEFVVCNSVDFIYDELFDLLNIFYLINSVQWR